jgi:hypothetical protein
MLCGSPSDSIENGAECQLCSTYFLGQNRSLKICHGAALIFLSKPACLFSWMKIFNSPRMVVSFSQYATIEMMTVPCFSLLFEANSCHLVHRNCCQAYLLIHVNALSHLRQFLKYNV